jgi:HD-like signal output (HDOD) protein
LLADPDVATKDIAKLISSDATLTARILQCVNSAGFGIQHSVGNVQHAVTLMGLDRTREVTLSLATRAYAKGALKTEELRRCWRHSIATAVLAEVIAQACGAFTDLAFTAGIMHDVGRLGLLLAYPGRYEQTIRNAAERCLDLLDFERQEFGFDHAEAGRELSESWGLPAEFCIVAGRHHDPCEGTELDLLRIVHTACKLADALGYDVTRPLIPLEIDAVLAELPPSAVKRLDASPEGLCARIEQRMREFDSEASVAPAEIAMDVPDSQPQPEPDVLRITEEKPTPTPVWPIVVIALTLLAAMAVYALFWRV